MKDSVGVLEVTKYRLMLNILNYKEENRSLCR